MKVAQKNLYLEVLEVLVFPVRNCSGLSYKSRFHTDFLFLLY